MGRYYRLSQSITVEMASEILREAKEVENVQEAEFLEDRSKILVVTEKENYPEVMTKLVNIFSRVGHGCEISFAGFAYAVDPSVIPYGTQVLINGHVFTAEDCGGAVRGNHIDIYVNDHQTALELGRGQAEVYLAK